MVAKDMDGNKLFYAEQGVDFSTWALKIDIKNCEG